MTKLSCYGCDGGHDSIEEVIACQSAEQRRVREALDAADAAEPKRDRRFLARNATVLKGRKVTGEGR